MDEFNFGPMFDFLQEQAKIRLATTFVARVQKIYFESLVDNGLDHEDAMRLVEIMSTAIVHEAGAMIAGIVKGDKP